MELVVYWNAEPNVRDYEYYPRTRWVCYVALRGRGAGKLAVGLYLGCSDLSWLQFSKFERGWVFNLKWLHVQWGRWTLYPQYSDDRERVILTIGRAYH